MDDKFFEIIKTDFSIEKIENSHFFFLDFFYYKKNITEFITMFKIFSLDEKANIIKFLLNLYPLSDIFLKEIFKTDKLITSNPMTLDTINFLCNAFLKEVGNLNLDFDLETKNYFKKVFELRDILELKKDKLDKFSNIKKEYFQLKEKDESLSKDIKELESANINFFREEVSLKQKKYDELKNEKNQMNKLLEKLEKDLLELNKYIEFKEKVHICRNIIKELNLNKDYSDIIKNNI